MAEKTRSNDDKIELGFLDKEKTKIMDSVDDGKMVAVLSGMEIMYIFLYYGEYSALSINSMLKTEDASHLK